jgi:acetyl esterase/lipase
MLIRRAYAMLLLAGVLLLPGSLAAQAASPVAEGTPAAEDEIVYPQVEMSVPYGDVDPAQQRMNIYKPEPRESPRPAIVLVHGGGFVSGSPEDNYEAPRFANAGFVTFSVGYRLFNEVTGENGFPAALDDVQLAMRWIRAHAAEYNVDPERIGAIGWSTGGQLAGLLGTMETRDTALPLQEFSSRVTCAVSISGDLDLTVPLSPSWAQLYEWIIGGTLKDDPELYEAASPVFHVDADTVPFLMTHGTADVDSPVQQSRNMVVALTDAGIEFVHAEFPGKDHGEATSQEQTWVLALTFVQYQLHPEA